MNYDLIPEELKPTIRQLVEQNKFNELLSIHNQYKLTPYHYTPCCLDGMMNHYRHGINEGLI